MKYFISLFEVQPWIYARSDPSPYIFKTTSAYPCEGRRADGGLLGGHDLENGFLLHGSFVVKRSLHILLHKNVFVSSIPFLGIIALVLLAC